MSIQRALNGVRTAGRQSGRLDAAFDRKDAFLAERKPAAIDRGVADLANLGVGHDQDDIAASGGRERKQIRVEANRPLRTVAAHLAADVGPDFRRLAGRNALGRLAKTSENVPLRKADHRLLRDLVDFERLAPAEPQHNDKASRRDGFLHCCPPGVRDAVGSADVAASKLV